jgi:hypothetical protein
MQDIQFLAHTYVRKKTKIPSRNKIERIKWAESTSSQGHSSILMRNKEINSYGKIIEPVSKLIPLTNTYMTAYFSGIVQTLQ